MRRFCIIVITLCILLAANAPATAFAANKPYAEEDALMREAPDKNSKALHTLGPNREITVKELVGSWYKVVYKGQTGYVYKTLIHGMEPEQNTTSTTGTVSSSSANPGTSAQNGILQKGDRNDAVSALQNALKQMGYFNEDITGLYGSVTQQAVTDFQKANSLTADGVAGPLTQSKIYESSAQAASANTVVSVGTSIPEATSSPAVQTAAYSYTTLKKGMVGDAVRALQTTLAAIGLFSDRIDGAYGDITENVIREFQEMNGLDADGVAGPSTLALLSNISGSNVQWVSAPQSNTPQAVTASNTVSVPVSSTIDTSGRPSNIELIYWFDAGKNAFTKKADARVYDVRTGRVYYVRSFSNGNHADVEPVTAEDTATIKSILNGVWDWDPRPVFVTVSGRTFAAAINGMPHGGQTIFDNNMEGQLCIHFKGSLTHNGNRSYEQDFQDAVDEAWRAASQ